MSKTIFDLLTYFQGIHANPNCFHQNWCKIRVWSRINRYHTCEILIAGDFHGNNTTKLRLLNWWAVLSFQLLGYFYSSRSSKDFYRPNTCLSRFLSVIHPRKKRCFLSFQGCIFRFHIHFQAVILSQILGQQAGVGITKIAENRPKSWIFNGDMVRTYMICLKLETRLKKHQKYWDVHGTY